MPRSLSRALLLDVVDNDPQCPLDPVRTRSLEHPHSLGCADQRRSQPRIIRGGVKSSGLGECIAE